MQDVAGLQALVTVLVAVLALTWLARELRIAPSIVLLLGGVPLAFLPWAPDVLIPPEVVLLIFLPALLYWESLTTSLREIRAHLRTVVLTSVVLVLVTAATVAAVGHAIGLDWPVAWVLGAVVAPTDAAAVAAVAGRMPRGVLTTLRAESLVNDGTALAAFAIAVAVASGEQQFSWAAAGGVFLLSYAGGAAAGLLVAWLAARVRRLVHDTLLENGISVLTPFAAFLLAEQVHASGVLAVVVCGLAMSRVGPRQFAARTRVQADAFWTITTFLLNGTLFVLVGLELPDSLQSLHSYSVGRAVLDALVVAGVVIGTRLAWAYTVPYLIRLVDRRPAQRLRRTSARHRLPAAWSGFRGGVSLAAALAVPVTLPGRDLIIVVTFGVILVTMLLQGLTLPAVLRWARLPDDGAEAREHRLARRTAAEAALAELPAAAERLALSEAVVDRVRAEYEELLHVIDDPEHPLEADDPTRADHEGYRALRAALLAAKRVALVRLRDDGSIDDIVLRRVQARLDAEEIRLATQAEADS